LDNADYIRDTLSFPGAQIALRVDRDIIADDGRVLLSDTRYFLTSLDPSKVTAAELLAHVRAHWQIENSLFFIKDRWWDEDRHWTRRPGVADWLTQLTSAALSVLRLLGPAELPIRARADRIAWQPIHGLKLLSLR
jgi:predicted transposase YbfD/YdcC